MIHGEGSKENKIVTIPNLLSLVRLCLIPVFMWLYLGRHDHVWATVVLVASGLTDMADGWVARRFNMISDLGKILDPIADKLTQAAVLLCLVFRFPFLRIALGVLVVKELFLAVAAALALRKSGEVHGARWHGKVTTTLLYAVMFVHLVWPQIPGGCSACLTAICVVMMLISMVLYAAGHIKIIKQ